MMLIVNDTCTPLCHAEQAVLTVLFALAASGVDLEQVLSGQYQP
jgi:hypothetical protein